MAVTYMTEEGLQKLKDELQYLETVDNGLKHEFIDYVLPLIQGEPELPLEHSLPRYARLKKVLAK